MADFIQLGDEGVNLRVIVYEDEDETTIFDVSGAPEASLKVWLGAPDGEVIELDNATNGVAFATDGSDGIIQYAIEDAATHDAVDGTPVLHIAGDWNIQAEWTQGGDIRHSTVAQFEVRENVEVS